MDGQNPVMMPEANPPVGRTGKSRSWMAWAVVAVIVVVAAILIFWQGPAAPGPAIGTEDHTSAIAEQLDSIDLGSLEAELIDINSELDQL